MCDRVSVTNFDWIGFDLDHSLIRYKFEPFYQLVFNCLVRYLVEQKNYSADLLDVRFDLHFCSRGVIFDKKLGNFLKLDHERRVTRAYHGTKSLTKELMQATYPESLDDFHGVRSDRWMPFITAFDAPAIFLVAVLVDRADAAEAASPQPAIPDYSQVFNQVLQGFNFLFANFHSIYFDAFRENIGRYVYRRPEVVAWLTQLRQQEQKRLFIVTNSHNLMENLASSTSEIT
eukprot:TRINITY_DN5621_c0_g1_i2.p1 TRINITY_DN5621_c0_g1~~TRINITY_DN5621_c0_g1_i2.p1  ORF type:complete len:255 (-),score=32.41 TRINITY_DN5621_c0_g1_i2:302-994(-)